MHLDKDDLKEIDKIVSKRIDEKVGKIVDEKVSKIVGDEINASEKRTDVKFAAFEKRTDVKFAAFEKRTDVKFNNLEKRLTQKIDDKVDEGIEFLARITNNGFAANEKAHKLISEDIADLNFKVSETPTKTEFHIHEKRIARTELKLGLKKS